jgi:hypothetical protein
MAPVMLRGMECSFLSGEDGPAGADAMRVR